LLGLGDFKRPYRSVDKNATREPVRGGTLGEGGASKGGSGKSKVLPGGLRPRGEEKRIQTKRPHADRMRGVRPALRRLLSNRVGGDVEKSEDPKETKGAWALETTMEDGDRGCRPKQLTLKDSTFWREIHNKTTSKGKGGRLAHSRASFWPNLQWGGRCKYKYEGE